MLKQNMLYNVCSAYVIKILNTVLYNEDWLGTTGVPLFHS